MTTATPGSTTQPTPARAGRAGFEAGRTERFGLLFGGFLGLALLKFVNPVVLESLVSRPGTLAEWLFTAWPSSVGYVLLALVAVVGCVATRADWLGQWGRAPWWAVLPAAWLLWQGVASFWSVDPALSRRTIWHFGSCVVCFYLGMFVAGRSPNSKGFFWPVCLAFFLVIASGFDQRFGGLERTREYFFTYLYGQMPAVPPEFLKRLESGRIFANQFYPNALAGVVLMLLPVSVVLIWQMERWFTRAARVFLVTVVGLAALACLIWSGSKGGWLLMLVLIALAGWHSALPFWLKRTGLVIGLVAGLTLFGVRYAGFFERGATSVSARFDYWQAALRTSLERPLFGSGPGTFGIAYKAIKRPESEMSRLAHNDYLQQASDSGWPGLVLYGTFIAVALWRTGPRVAQGGAVAGTDWLRFAVWLGVLGWALQGLIEFGLYLPSLAWCAFAWLGWLAAGSKRVDNSGAKT